MHHPPHPPRLLNALPAPSSFAFWQPRTETSSPAKPCRLVVGYVSVVGRLVVGLWSFCSRLVVAL